MCAAARQRPAPTARLLQDLAPGSVLNLPGPSKGPCHCAARRTYGDSLPKCASTARMMEHLPVRSHIHRAPWSPSSSLRPPSPQRTCGRTLQRYSEDQKPQLGLCSGHTYRHPSNALGRCLRCHTNGQCHTKRPSKRSRWPALSSDHAGRRPNSSHYRRPATHTCDMCQHPRSGPARCAHATAVRPDRCCYGPSRGDDGPGQLHRNGSLRCRYGARACHTR